MLYEEREKKSVTLTEVSQLPCRTQQIVRPSASATHLDIARPESQEGGNHMCQCCVACHECSCCSDRDAWKSVTRDVFPTSLSTSSSSCKYAGEEADRQAGGLAGGQGELDCSHDAIIINGWRIR